MLPRRAASAAAHVTAVRADGDPSTPTTTLLGPGRAGVPSMAPPRPLRGTPSTLAAGPERSEGRWGQRRAQRSYTGGAGLGPETASRSGLRVDHSALAAPEPAVEGGVTGQHTGRTLEQEAR